MSDDSLQFLCFVLPSFYLIILCSWILAIVGPLWHTFVTTLKVYEQSSVEGSLDSFEGRYDSDGAERSLESFVMQVQHFLFVSINIVLL